MEYDVRVRVQGAPGETGQAPPLIVDTEGHLAVERGHCALSYYQYEGEEAVPVKTSIRLERSTVAMERSDHTTMVFDRKRPSFHPVLTQSGRLVSMMVIPHRVEWNQRRGRGSLRLAYDLVYDGRITSNHDILFEFAPSHGAL